MEEGAGDRRWRGRGGRDGTGRGKWDGENGRVGRKGGREGETVEVKEGKGWRE